VTRPVHRRRAALGSLCVKGDSEWRMGRRQAHRSLLSQFGVAFGVHDSELRMERIQVRHSLLSQFDVAFRVHNSGLRKQPMAARFIRLILNPV